MKLSKNTSQIISEFLSFLPDKIFCSITFLIKNKRFPNLDKPVFFNDKLLKLKLTYRDPIQHVLVDKYAVREYIKEVIGQKYLIPLIGAFESFEEIDFFKLPNKFVLKINNGSQNNFVCNDKLRLNWSEVSSQVKKWLNIDYYKRTREWPYKGINTKILIEEYLVDPSGDLFDYKFWCFDGKPTLLQIDMGRFSNHRRDFYDCESFEKLDYIISYPQSDDLIERPKNFIKMIEIAKKLSANFKFLRVDLYNIDGEIYFGELTFFPGNCNEPIKPVKVEKELGALLIL